jgi:hypothetical protein
MSHRVSEVCCASSQRKFMVAEIKTRTTTGSQSQDKRKWMDQTRELGPEVQKRMTISALRQSLPVADDDARTRSRLSGRNLDAMPQKQGPSRGCMRWLYIATAIGVMFLQEPRLNWEES